MWSVSKVLASAQHFALCDHWIHKRCSGSKGKLVSDINFKCKVCLDPKVVDVKCKVVEFDGNKYEVVNKLCYLGQIISAKDGAKASIVTRLRFG